MKYLVRTNCEYSTAIEADSEAEAIAKANEIPPTEWPGTAWSSDEAEPLAPLPPIILSAACPGCGYTECVCDDESVEGGV